MLPLPRRRSTLLPLVGVPFLNSPFDRLLDVLKGLPPVWFNDHDKLGDRDESSVMLSNKRAERAVESSDELW